LTYSPVSTFQCHHTGRCRRTTGCHPELPAAPDVVAVGVGFPIGMHDGRETGGCRGIGGVGVSVAVGTGVRVGVDEGVFVAVGEDEAVRLAVM